MKRSILNLAFSRAFMQKKAVLVISILILLAVWFAPLQTVMPQAAQRTLALGLLTVIWWAFKIIPQAYTSLLLIAALLVFRVAEPAVVLTMWTRPLVWLIICSFLISAAVSKSGLARRFALFLMSRFSPTYTRTVLLIYLIGLLMSLFIPQTFPRLLILMAVVREVIHCTDTAPKTAIA
ncbi:MAG: SLC13 family permease, partial [Anaerolineaceae bacterium]